MRYRVRGTLPDGRSVITKVTADDEFSAVAAAAKDFRDSGFILATIKLGTVKALDAAKSSVYIGQAPKGKSKRGRKPASATAPAMPAEPTPETQPEPTPAEATPEPALAVVENAEAPRGRRGQRTA